MQKRLQNRILSLPRTSGAPPVRSYAGGERRLAVPAGEAHPARRPGEDKAPRAAGKDGAGATRGRAAARTRVGLSP